YGARVLEAERREHALASFRRPDARSEPGLDRGDELGLRLEQRPWVDVAPLAEQELHEEQPASVANVLYRLGPPAPHERPPAPRRPQDGSPRPARRSRARGLLDQPLVAELVDCAIHERTRKRPDAADLAVGCERTDGRPPVRRLLVEQCEHRPL